MTADFLTAICTDPSDDTPRLIFADWLDDESGEATERSEFIRIGCDIAKADEALDILSRDQFLILPESKLGQRLEWIRGEKAKLRRRSLELLAKNIGAWTEDLPDELTMKPCPHCEEGVVDYETNVIECGHCDCTGFIFDDDAVEFSRGFVGHVTLTEQLWEAHGPAIVRAAPITSVTLSDSTVRGPAAHYHDDAPWYLEEWYLEEGWGLSTELFGLLEGYSSEDRRGSEGRQKFYRHESEAKRALSSAAVRLARDRADLPRLAPKGPLCHPTT